MIRVPLLTCNPHALVSKYYRGTNAKFNYYLQGIYMSVEKLSDSSQTILENVPFTQISNHVIEHIKDNDAYRIWSYCFSKSRNWKVYKEFTEKVCGIGSRKGEYIWSYLKRSGLIDYEKVMDSCTGKFLRTDIKILSGSKFNHEEPFIKQKTTPALSAVAVKSVDKSTPALSAAAEMYPLLNKDITNKEKTKSFCVSRLDQKKINEKKHDWAENSNYPKQITKFWGPGHPDYDRLHLT